MSQPIPRKRPRSKGCFACGEPGHIRAACPKIASPPPAHAPVPTPVAAPIGTVPASPAPDRLPFNSLGLPPSLVSAVAKGFGYTQATPIQSLAIPIAARALATGKDVLAQAATGTGKTLAFLLPILSLLAASPGASRSLAAAVIISPTRELAMQIAAEAKTLGVVRTDVVVGGTNMSAEKKRLERNPPTILVATPGRLLDHLRSTAFVRDAVAKAKVLVLDEADRLLDMGFRPDIMRILEFLPPVNNRFTMLFSATFPDQVSDLTQVALRPAYERVQAHRPGTTLDAHGNPNAASSPPIPQRAIVVDPHTVVEALLDLFSSHADSSKAMVFFTTARLTQYYANLFEAMRLPGFNVYEMHSRKAMNHRLKCSARYRDARSTRPGEKHVMFTSDVSARGMDYPEVMLVIQVGLPADLATYTHRIGRTARAGAGGEAILIVSKGGEDTAAKRMMEQGKRSMDWQTLALQPRPEVQRAAGSIPAQLNGQAYQAWMGYYNSHLKKLRWNKAQLVAMANTWALAQFGTTQPPTLQKRTVGKMGLKGVPGLRVQ